MFWLYVITALLFAIREVKKSNADDLLVASIVFCFAFFLTPLYLIIDLTVD